MEQRYAIAVIGCGPAGLSAALNAKIRNKSLILFGENGVSEKVTQASLIQNYLGLPAVSGEELKDAFFQHIRQMGISIANVRIDGIYPMGDYFVLSSQGKMYEAKTNQARYLNSRGENVTGIRYQLLRYLRWCTLQRQDSGSCHIQRAAGGGRVLPGGARGKGIFPAAVQ